MIYALIMTVRRFKSYFQAHTITVLKDQQLRSILQRVDTSDQIVKWPIEFSKFDIYYRLRTAVKGQILADFVIECTIQMMGQSRQVPKVMIHSEFYMWMEPQIFKKVALIWFWLVLTGSWLNRPWGSNSIFSIMVLNIKP